MFNSRSPASEREPRFAKARLFRSLANITALPRRAKITI